MDLEKAIRKSKEAAQIISHISTSFSTEAVSLPAVGIGLCPDGNKEYRLVFQLASDADRKIVNDLYNKLDIQETPHIEVIGQAFSLPSVPNPINVSRCRPLRLGAHISPLNFTAGGTLGCFVRKKTDPTNLFILSCTHVIAPLDECCLGNKIIQPGGTSSIDDIVAELDDFIPLSPDNTDTALDAAIAKIVCEETLRINIDNFRESARLKGNHKADELSLFNLLGRNVLKTGSTTGVTYGNIKAIVPQSIWYRDNTIKCHYQNLISINSNESNSTVPFSRHGDSGSLIYDEDGYAVGLLIGGTTSGTTYALPIEPILNRLGIELILS
jgi:hypothetical protein